MNELIKKRDEFKDKIITMLQDEELKSNNEEITLYDLKTILSESMKEYNVVFIDDSTKFVLNRKVKKNNFNILKPNSPCLPYIRSICPSLNENGYTYIELLFNNYYNILQGSMIIDENKNYYIKSLRNEYNQDFLRKFIKDNYSLFEPYFNELNKFKEEYPNTKCIWNNEFASSMKNQKFTHDFLEVVFNLDRHDIATIIPNNIDDIPYFTDNFDNENPLDIYLTTYTDSFLKRIKVNIEDLNPLYKSIVTKHLNNEMTMKRVK